MASERAIGADPLGLAGSIPALPLSPAGMLPEIANNTPMGTRLGVKLSHEVPILPCLIP